MAWDRERHRRHLPPNWAAIRVQVLRRDNYECLLCGDRATDVDHIGSRDNHKLYNLRSLCRPCHQHRTSKQGVKALNAGKARARKRLRRPVEKHPGLL